MVRDEEGEGKRVKEVETRQEAPFPVEGARIGPDAEARNGRLKQVLLRDKPEVIRLSRGKLSFLPAGFFVGLRPPTSIHSRLTLLFTVCGCLAGFLPLIGIFFRRASTFFCLFFAVVIRVSDNDQWISIMSNEIELFWTCRDKKFLHNFKIYFDQVVVYEVFLINIKKMEEN